MTDWTLLQPSRYSVGTQTDGDITALTLTKQEGESNFDFDDGLIIQFE